MKLSQDKRRLIKIAPKGQIDTVTNTTCRITYNQIRHQDYQSLSNQVDS